jgi:Bardet-Biedl syndrome 9 protein
MSIFEAKEWWSTVIANDEEFDNNSICIDNIDNETPAKDKICVSSFKGFLRIYEPTFGPNRVQNLLFEKFYDNPILQIASGSFIFNSNEKQLAILQSKRLLVLQILNLKGVTSIKTCYDHKLPRNGFNFCLGRIGEKNLDIIFVQSIEGVISIYEQDHLVNAIAINDILMPGPTAFLSRKDYFLISNTSYEVECYSYNNLATVKSNSDDKKIMYSWVVNLGELVRDIKVIDNKITRKQEVMVLTETMLHLLEDSGKIIFQKKLDYEPMSLYVYNIEDPNYSPNKQINLMYAIATHSDHILVYKGLNLVWAIKVHDNPIYLSINEFEGMKGLIVNLSDTGRLNVLYLGTEPARNDNMIIPSKALDMNVVANETERLTQIIENFEKGVVTVPVHTLGISADILTDVFHDDDIFQDKIYYTDTYGKILRSQVNLTFSFDGNEAENVKISIVTPWNVVCDDPSFTIERLTPKNSPFTRPINFKVINYFYPTFTNVKVYATYFIKSIIFKIILDSEKSSDKSIQSTFLEFELPLNLFLSTVTPSKEAKHKITLCTNKDVINVILYITQIPTIFKDLTESFKDSEIVKANTNIIGFSYPNKSDVTIIVSKNGGRYRIQSSNYEALLFITHQMAIRLNEHFQYDITIYTEDDLYLSDYVNIVENHYKLFNTKKSLNEELEKYTSLYTIVQKNLLSKYKVTTCNFRKKILRA